MEAHQLDLMDIEEQYLDWDPLWGYDLPDLGQALAPLEEQQSPLPRSTQQCLGKRGRGGSQPARCSSAHRGVSFHPRTGRHEAHIWVNGKQLYLAGVYHEEMAALAHDLAAVRVRGADAVTNFPLDLYAAELAEGDKLPLDHLVAHLRAQAKSLARIDATAGTKAACCMEPWELELSEAISGQQSLGVYASETEAARAVDRALLARDGLAAAPLLSFPLASYVPELAPALLQQALQEGALKLEDLQLPVAAMVPFPAAVPVPSPTAVPAASPIPASPFYHPGLSYISTNSHADISICGLAGANCADVSTLSLPQVHLSSLPEQPDAAAEADSWMAPPLPAPVARKASMTPRMSLLG